MFWNHSSNYLAKPRKGLGGDAKGGNDDKLDDSGNELDEEDGLFYLTLFDLILDLLELTSQLR